MDANPLFGERRARDRYDLLVADITRAISDADPKSLLEIGAPPDEYSPEVGTIVPRVAKATGPGEVRTILHEEFERWFGEGGPLEAYDVPAAKIWDAVLAFRSGSRCTRFEVLAGLPGEGPLPEYFGFEAHGRYREGFVVRFFPINGDSWIGNFQAGLTNLSRVIDVVSSQLVLVIAGGHAYEVDVEDRRLVREFGGSIEYFLDVPSNDGVVVGNGLWFECVRLPDDQRWRTRRLSWDGMRNLAVNGLVLSGEGYNPMDDDWTPFEVDLRDGSALGGSYDGPE